MKQILLIVMLVVANLTFAQNVKQNGNNFQQVKTEKTVESKSIKTEYTFTTTKGEVYDIYLSVNGRAYINRVSAKSGNTYKYYIGEETSKTLCRIYGIEYKENPKKQ